MIHDPLSEQTSSYTLSSAGFGVRVRQFDHLNGEFAAAFALRDGPNTRTGAPRFLFRLYGDF